MTDSRGLYAGLERLYLPIAAAVFVIFLLVVLFAVVRYRRRGDELPSQKHESKAEYVYAGGLALIAAFLVGATFDRENRTDAHPSGRPGLRVEVTAARWNWRFTYPRYGVSIVAPREPTLVVPAGTLVAFTGTSQDVIHSFWVPDLRFKKDVFPAAVTHWHLTWPEPVKGMLGECAEYCGLLHADMRFRVDALPEAQFRSWIRRQQAAQGTTGA